MGLTCDASDEVAARPTCGAARKDCWEWRFSFFHSDYTAVAIGVHNCGDTWGGRWVDVNNSFSVVISTALMVATITVKKMFPSIPFGGILTTIVLLPPAVPPTIHLR